MKSCSMAHSGGPALRRAAGSLALLLLAACASPDWEKPGALREDVLARLGTPRSTQSLPDGGQRLLYSTLPAGYQVFHLDFDASGRLVRTTQVLTQQRFESIPVNQWSARDVEASFGPPIRLEQVARFDGDIWTYHFIDDLGTRRFAYVHIDRAGVVRRVMFADEFSGGREHDF